MSATTTTSSTTSSVTTATTTMPINNQMAIDTVHTAPVNNEDPVTKKQKTNHPVSQPPLSPTTQIKRALDHVNNGYAVWHNGKAMGVSTEEFPQDRFQEQIQIILQLSTLFQSSSGGGKGNSKKSKTPYDKGTTQPPPSSYSGVKDHLAIKWLLHAAQNKYIQSKSDEYPEDDPIHPRVLQMQRIELYKPDLYKAELAEWSKAKGFSEQACRDMGTSIYETAMAESTKTSAKAKHEDAKVTANEPYKTFVTSSEMVKHFSEALPHIYNKCVPPPGLAQVDGEEVSVTVEKCLAALREMKQADEDADEDANAATPSTPSTSSSTSSTSSVTSSPPPSSPLPSPPSSPSLVAPPIAPVAPVDATTVKSEVSNGEAAPVVPADVKMDETSSSSDDSDEDDEEDEATQLILQDMEDNLEEE